MTDVDISLGPAKAMKQGAVGTCCGYGGAGMGSNFDCIQIPSATNKSNKVGSIVPAMGFCGQAGLFTKDAKSAEGDRVTICCK